MEQDRLDTLSVPLDPFQVAGLGGTLCIGFCLSDCNTVQAFVSSFSVAFLCDMMLPSSALKMVTLCSFC
jgi:hypothetical protein